MTENYEIECSPPRDEWGALLDENATILSSLFLSHPQCAQARRTLLEEAEQYDRYLADKAAALSIPYPTFVRGSDQIIACGHQPVTVHSGLFEKYRQLNTCASERGFTGVNFVLDIDAGGLDVLFSAAGKVPEELVRIGHSLTEGHGWYGGQKVSVNSSLESFLDEAVAGLQQAGSPAVQSMMRLREYIRKLDGWSVVDAQTFLRRVFHGSLCGGTLQYVDVPLQQLMRTPAAIEFAATFLFQTEGVHSTYNRVLAEHRKARKIKNPANPFPDLEQHKQMYEMPFWLFHAQSGKRTHLYVQQISEDEILLTGAEDGSPSIRVTRSTVIETLREQSDSILIVPRAAFLSLLFRLLYADFFIHGRGGARYDECTNAFITEWFSIQAPAFATVSADRYLFPAVKENLDTLDALKKNLRDIIYHPQLYREQGLLSEEDELQIRSIQSEKEQSVKQLKELKKQGESVAHLTQEIRSYDTRVRVIVEEAFERYAGAYASLSSDAMQAISERTYPFFLFLDSAALPESLEVI